MGVLGVSKYVICKSVKSDGILEFVFYIVVSQKMDLLYVRVIWFNIVVNYSKLLNISLEVFSFY